MDHWSDCAVNNAPALPAGVCDCRGLDLSIDNFKGFIPALVSKTGCMGLLINQMGRESFIEVEQLEPSAFPANGATAHLPYSHSVATFIFDPDSVDFDNARKAIVSEFKALLLSNSLLGNAT